MVIVEDGVDLECHPSPPAILLVIKCMPRRGFPPVGW